MDRLKIYFLSTRPQFLPAVAVPVLLGASVAWHSMRKFDLLLFILSLIAALLYHAGMNVVNDYFDFVNGTDNINKKALSPFTGGSLFIQKGLITPMGTLAFGLILLFLGSAVGVYLAYRVTMMVLVIGAIGFFFGFFYSAPPLFLVGRGLGEISVGISFGVLTVLGAYLVQTGEIAVEPVFSSLPLSFLITALLYVNEFPDFEADREAGKNTLVVRLGPRKARYGMVVIISCAYISLITGVALGFLPVLSLIALLPSVLAVKGVSGLIKNYEGSPTLIPSIRAIILAHLLTGVLLVISNLF